MKNRRAKIRSIEPTEHQIQCGIVEWANNTRCYRDENFIGDFLIAIPNGGKRSITEAVRFKKEGVKKGVCDLFLCCPYSWNYDDWFHGLWIEVKSKKGVISKHQKKWMDLMKDSDYRVVVVRDIEEGIYAIKSYLNIH